MDPYTLGEALTNKTHTHTPQRFVYQVLYSFEWCSLPRLLWKSNGGLFFALFFSISLRSLSNKNVPAFTQTLRAIQLKLAVVCFVFVLPAEHYHVFIWPYQWVDINMFIFFVRDFTFFHYSTTIATTKTNCFEIIC